MRIRILIAVVLISVVTPAYGDDEAEGLFRELERKFAARTVEVRTTVERVHGRERETTRYVFLVAEKGRLRLDAQADVGPVSQMSIVCDGKRAWTITPGQRQMDFETEAPPGFARDVLAALVRTTSAQAFLYANQELGEAMLAKVRGRPSSSPRDPVRFYEASSFSLASTEKLGDRDARAIVYRLRFEDDPTLQATVTLWIDAETGLPLRRTAIQTWNGESATFTEVFERVALDGPVGDGAFEIRGL